MSSKPPLLSDEELLNALEKGEEVVVTEKNEILKFIEDFKLAPGKNATSSKGMHKVFKLHTGSRLSYSEFSNKLATQLPRKDGCFYIDDSTISGEIKKLLTPEPKKMVKDKTKDGRFIIHFEAFLKANQVKPKSDIWVEDFILFYIYDAWWYGKKKELTPLKKGPFTKFLKLHFEHFEKDNINYFHLDDIIYTIMSFERMQNYRTSYAQKQKEKAGRR